MLDDFSAPAAQERLRTAIQSGKLTAAGQSQAEKLFERLKSGVCVTILGPKGVGKSQLSDVLAGVSSCDAVQSQTRILSHSPEKVPNLQHLGDSIVITMPDGPLGQAALIDVAAPDDPLAFKAQMDEALSSADIALWCTQAFDQVEQQIWAQTSDALKDNSFLVLTKADLMSDPAALAQRIATLQTIVEQEFHSLLPTTTSRLAKTLQNGEPVPDQLWSASGVKALVDVVAKIVSSGQRADLDSALLFLERHGLLGECEPAAATEVLAKPAEPRNSVHDTGPFRRARDVIMEQALDLAELSFDDTDADHSAVLDVCGTISEQVIELLQDEIAQVPEVAPWCAAFEEASDKIMLMAMENDTRSAADAVTILLQVRRDLEQLSV